MEDTKIIDNDKLNGEYLITEYIPEYSTVVFYKSIPGGVELLLTNDKIPPSFRNESFEVINFSNDKELLFNLSIPQIIQNSSKRLFEEVHIDEYVSVRMLLCSIFIFVQVEDYKLKQNNPLVGKLFSDIEIFLNEWISKLRKQIESTNGITMAVI